MWTGRRLFTGKNRQSTNNVKNAAKQHEKDCGVKVIDER